MATRIIIKRCSLCLQNAEQKFSLLGLFALTCFNGTLADKGTSPTTPGDASEEDGRHPSKYVKVKKPSYINERK